MSNQHEMKIPLIMLIHVVAQPISTFLRFLWNFNMYHMVNNISNEKMPVSRANYTKVPTESLEYFENHISGFIWKLSVLYFIPLQSIFFLLYNDTGYYLICNNSQF